MAACVRLKQAGSRSFWRREANNWRVLIGPGTGVAPSCWSRFAIINANGRDLTRSAFSLRAGLFFRATRDGDRFPHSFALHLRARAPTGARRDSPARVPARPLAHLWLG